jgi:hypothetical protein
MPITQHASRAAKGDTPNQERTQLSARTGNAHGGATGRDREMGGV